MNELQQAQGQALTPALPALIGKYLEWLDRTPITSKAYLSHLRQFGGWMRYKGITTPERRDIISYRDWLTSEHPAIIYDVLEGWRFRTDEHGDPVVLACKPATVAAYVRSLKQFFRWTASVELYPDIAANVRVPHVTKMHRKDALTGPEVLDIERSIERKADALVQSAQDAQAHSEERVQRATEQGARLRAMYMLAVNAGLRTVELSRANVKDLETKGGQAWLWVWGKGHTEPDARKPLAPEVAAAVRDYLATRADNPKGSSPLFIGTGNRNGGKRMLPRSISRILKEAMVEAGYNSERLTPHSLRHTAGTAVMALTGNLYTTQKYMRHADPSTTELYVHINTDAQEAETARLLYAYYHDERNDAP